MKAWLITKYRLIKVWSCNYFPIIINPIKDCNYMNSLFQITHSESSKGPQRRSSCCFPSSDGNTETLRGEMTFQGHTAVMGRAGLNPSSCPHRPRSATVHFLGEQNEHFPPLQGILRWVFCHLTVSPPPQSYLASSVVSLWNWWLGDETSAPILPLN